MLILLCTISGSLACRVDRDGWGLCRFDGDGMLHAVRIKDGKAAYSNAYVQTSRFKQERKAGRPLFFRVSTSSYTPENPLPCLHLQCPALANNYSAPTASFSICDTAKDSSSIQDGFPPQKLCHTGNACACFSASGRAQKITVAYE